MKVYAQIVIGICLAFALNTILPIVLWSRYGVNDLLCGTIFIIQGMAIGFICLDRHIFERDKP